MGSINLKKLISLTELINIINLLIFVIFYRSTININRSLDDNTLNAVIALKKTIINNKY